MVRILHRQVTKGNQLGTSRKIIETAFPGRKFKDSSTILPGVLVLLQKGRSAPAFKVGRGFCSLQVFPATTF